MGIVGQIIKNKLRIGDSPALCRQGDNGVKYIEEKNRTTDKWKI